MTSVIVGHITGGGGYAIIYFFHLPLFFIITGYLFSYKGDIKNFFKKKTRGYLIPYICCMFINTLILSIWDEVPFDSVRQFVLQIRFPTLWFLLALYSGILVFCVIVKSCKENYKLIFLICTITSAFFLCIEECFKVPFPWNFDTALIIQFYLVFGYGIKKYSLLDVWNNLVDGIKLLTIVLLVGISIIFTYFNSYLCNEPFIMSYSEYGIIALTIPASCLMSVAVLFFSSYIKRLPVIEWIGENSFTFFAFHKPLGIEGMYLLCSLCGINDIYVRALVAFGGTLGICYILHIIICKSKLKFIIGK